jgi:hypothetical protein
MVTNNRISPRFSKEQLTVLNSLKKTGLGNNNTEVVKNIVIIWLESKEYIGKVDLNGKNNAK